jgi:hypothetical protein
MKSTKFILIALVLTIICVSFSYWYSRYVSYTDFPVLYNSASYYLKEKNALEDIYGIWISHTYHLPEDTNHGKFIYSPVGLVLLSPLGYFDYYNAKTILMSLNMLSYFSSIYLILKLLELPKRWFIYFFSLSVFWKPFWVDVMFGQINSILLLLITFAVYNLKNKNPLISGSLIGLAASFKLFPIGIAMTLGIRSFRVLLGCALFSILLLTLPGSIKWFSAIHDNQFIELSPAYQLLDTVNPNLGYIYSAIISLITALIIYKSRVYDPLKIVSYSIPAIFLAAPVIEYYHLTLLIISYFFLMNYAKNNNRLIHILIPLLSFFLITFGYFWDDLDLIVKREIYYISIFLLWLAYADIFSSDCNKSTTNRQAS